MVFAWPWDAPTPPPPPTLLEEWSETLVWGTGWLGFCLTLCLTQMPTATSMAIMEVVTNAMYIAHYGLQGALGGLASQTIGMLNGLLSYNDENATAKMLHKLLPLSLLPLGWLSCEGLVDLVPLLATGLRLFAYQFKSVLRIRLLQVLSSCAWLTYGFLIESSPTITTSVACMALTLIAIARSGGAESAAKKSA
jgi:hypothetical protein